MTDPRDQTLSRAEDPEHLESERGNPQLVLLLESQNPLAGSMRFELDGLDLVTIGRGQARNSERSRSGRERSLTIRVPDQRMSSTHLELRRIHGRWVASDQASKNGSLLNGETFQQSELGELDLLELGHTFFMFFEERLGSSSRMDLDQSDLDPPAPELATWVEPLARQFELLRRVAPSKVPVLILGETGTGKEVVARAIHNLSKRSGAFVAVNCGAIPQHLIEAELFGAKKGAFSGADQDRTGLVESAQGGTLFLDELGDLKEASQAALLRVLQEREVLPVGSSRPIPVDFRMIAATHRDLDSLVASGRFRGDLLARSNGHILRLPPLRERREDLGLLICAQLEKHGKGRTRLAFSPTAARALLSHSWPYNIRELDKCIETALVLADDETIKLEHLPREVRAEPRTEETSPSPEELTDDEKKHREELLSLLQAHGGNLAAVARATGKARMQVHRWLKRYRLDADKFRS